jgi:hypothetical protein
VLCGIAVPGFLPAEAYSQFNASQMYDGTLATQVPFDSLPAYTLPVLPRPGSAFSAPQYATVSGIHLPDPLNTAWPARAANVGTAAAPMNGIYWTDDDRDGKRGVTSFVTPPGGEGISLFPVNGQPYPPGAQQTFPDPPNCNAADEYAYVPFPRFNYTVGTTMITGTGVNCGTGAFYCRVKATFGASRVVSSLAGTIGSTCDRMSGTVTIVKTESRVGGCVVATHIDEMNPANDTHADCDTGYQGVANTGDQLADEPQDYGPTTFIIKKVPQSLLDGGLNCAEIRTQMNFD